MVCLTIKLPLMLHTVLRGKKAIVCVCKCVIVCTESECYFTVWGNMSSTCLLFKSLMLIYNARQVIINTRQTITGCEHFLVKLAVKGTHKINGNIYKY